MVDNGHESDTGMSRSRNDVIKYCMWKRFTMGTFHLMTQVDTSIVLSFYLLNAKKDRTMFVSTCVIKWKAPNM